MVKICSSYLLLNEHFVFGEQKIDFDLMCIGETDNQIDDKIELWVTTKF